MDLSRAVYAVPLLAMVLTTGIAPAQQPRGFYAWWDSPMVENLQLTAQQKGQIRETVRSYRGKIIDERAALQKAEGELGDLFNDERFDTRKTGEAIDRLAAARADLTRTLTQMAMQLRNALTVEQWRELQRRRPLAAARAGESEGGGISGAGVRRLGPRQRALQQQQPATQQPQK